MATPVSPEHQGPILPRWWLWVGGINALILGSGFAVKAGWTGNKYVRKLAPNWEYTLGNWWSAMLMLAFAGLLAVAAEDRTIPPKARWAMRVLSWLGLGLSLDELGSLHERASDLVPLPGHWSLAPFALLFLLAAAWSLRELWLTGKTYRDVCLLILLGFTFLGSAEPYDMVEHTIQTPGWYTPFGVVIEEGLELLGGTLLLSAGLALAGKPSQKTTPYQHVPRFGLTRCGHLLIVSVIPLVVMRQLLKNAETLDLHSRGDFGAAPAVMLFALAAGAFAVRAVDKTKKNPLWWVLACLCLFASIELGCNLTAWVMRESVGAPLGAWWAQVIFALAGYVMLRLATGAATPVTGSSRAGVA